MHCKDGALRLGHLPGMPLARRLPPSPPRDAGRAAGFQTHDTGRETSIGIVEEMVRPFSSLKSLARAVGASVVAITCACTSLPTVPAGQSDEASQRHEVRIDGPHGPLSDDARKRVLDRLEAQGENTGIFSRHLAFEQEIVGAPLSAGNKVTLLQDGPSTYRAMVAAMQAATTSINMESYIFEADEVGRQFAQELAAAAARGVTVNLIYDSVGTIGTPKEFFTDLAAHGVHTLEFNPVNPLTAHGDWSVNKRDHRKLTVVDGKTAFVGGINISSVYSGGSVAKGSNAKPGQKVPWRDTDLMIEGPAVADFQHLFLDTWARQKGPPLAQVDYFPKVAAQGNAVVRAIGGTPAEPYSQIYATLVSAIRSAETSILLANAYFDPDPRLLTALTDAARRGVDVRLLLPSVSDSWLVLAAGRRHYGELLEAGVRIYERRNALLHSKTTVIDGVWCTIGSTNLDWRSFLHNDEIQAVVLSPEFGDQMQAAFAQDMAQSTPLTLEAWQQRPMLDHVQEIAAGMWEYWL
jgi:cardiolipin synthase